MSAVVRAPRTSTRNPELAALFGSTLPPLRRNTPSVREGEIDRLESELSWIVGCGKLAYLKKGEAVAAIAPFADKPRPRAPAVLSVTSNASTESNECPLPKPKAEHIPAPHPSTCSPVCKKTLQKNKVSTTQKATTTSTQKKV